MQSSIQVNDTYRGMKVSHYRDVLSENGFVLDLHENCGEAAFRKHGYQDLFEIWYHPSGLLLFFDTFREDSVNYSKVWYQIKDVDGNLHKFMSSGKWQSKNWNDLSSPRYLCGDHNASSDLIFNIRNLSEHGEFANPWPFPDDMHIWLVAYWEDKISDYNKFKHARLSRCSEKVRKLVGIC